jgi:hypothetical protein
MIIFTMATACPPAAANISGVSSLELRVSTATPLRNTEPSASTFPVVLVFIQIASHDKIQNVS